METITGYMNHIVYRNGENGYTVFSLENENGSDLCRETSITLMRGELLELEGDVNHQHLRNPVSCEAVTEVKNRKIWCPSNGISAPEQSKGVGAALAHRIVRRFKEDTFRIIEGGTGRLAEIKGISERKAREIAIQVEEKKKRCERQCFCRNMAFPRRWV